MKLRKNIQHYIFIFIGIFLVLISSCKKNEESTPATETGTVRDIEGNIYQTIKIGNQWWMVENLRVKKYRDSTAIVKIQDDTAQWKNDTTGAYCLYDDNPNAPGLLYNWYAVNNLKKIAPEGWHIPSDDDWKILEKYLGMSEADADKTGWRGTHEGEKLKVPSPKGWTLSGSIWSQNESGFSALAGGSRLFNGTWGDPGLFATGFWWSSSSSPGEGIWYRYLDYKNANIFRYYTTQNYGFSIRCVKD